MLNPAFDEFVKRKNIDVKSCFLPKHKNYFFINCNEKLNWHLVEVYWKSITGHPSHFVVNIRSSKYNSFKDSFGKNFVLQYSKNGYWDEIEDEIKFAIVNGFNLNYSYLINQKHQAKVISWLFFVNSIGDLSDRFDLELKNAFSFKNLDNFYKFKEYEYEIDKILLFLKRKHKIIHNYYEVYFEQEYLDFYWYDSYYFLSELFFQSKLKSRIYTI